MDGFHPAFLLIHGDICGWFPDSWMQDAGN